MSDSEGEFDAAVSSGVIYYFPEPVRAALAPTRHPHGARLAHLTSVTTGGHFEADGAYVPPASAAERARCESRIARADARWNPPSASLL